MRVFIAIIRSRKRLLIKFKGERVMKKVVVFLMAVLLIALGVMSTSAASVPLTEQKQVSSLENNITQMLGRNIIVNYNKANFLLGASASTECYVTPANFCYVWARLQLGTEIVFDSAFGGTQGSMTMTPIYLSERNTKAEQVWNGAYRTVDGQVSGERDVDAKIEIYDIDYYNYMWRTYGIDLMS